MTPNDEKTQRRAGIPDAVSDETMAASADLPTAKRTRKDEKLPESIGRYRIEKVLGRGGFGCVYLAFDDELRRNVTIKVPHDHRVTSETDIEEFLAEARTLAMLEHPHVVPVHDIGQTDDGICYIVSRYIDGSDLSHRKRTAPLSIGESVELIATIAEALHYAHTHKVIHRDVKPTNILLDRRGTAYIADFGLALLEEDAATSNTVTGTPAYMSPEQARGENHLVSGTSDIFSLGVVLYELVSGIRPFQAHSARATLQMVQEQEVRALRDINRDIPAELERICMKAISKRASDRHCTALDFAEDLRDFLADEDGLHLVSGMHPSEETTSSGKSRASRKALGIVPRGLRSFGSEDAHFFLGLLPGPYDRDGTPESILFWKRRIEELDPQNSFRVGLIYGPSGCGKSSFVKAGLLPTLSKNVTTVFVEAAPDATENRLLNRLRRHCSYLDTALGLRESIARLRHGGVMGEGKKVLIVIDQFEQWLYSVEQPEHSELAKAMRQCDGEHVQCILLVRDDFWLAFSRFMDHLEIELLQNRNMALVDLFDPLHARKVLTEFGRAYDRLPEHYSEFTRDQRTFVAQAVDGIAENGKVTPVRLALFAEMIKSKPWTTSTLKRIGGTTGVGVMFLDENFVADTAPADYRIHQKAVYETLGELLPEPGTDLKGHMRSREELMQASGYADRPKQFKLLMRALDSDLHLITRTDPEGRGDDSISAIGSGSSNRSESPSTQSASLSQNVYYQLAHDYLVPAIRDWRSRMQRETRQGRAEIRLAQRAEIWQARPDTRHLPTWPEWVSIMVLTQRDHWIGSQRRMMKAATKRHTMMTIIVVAATVLVVCGINQFLSWNRASSLTDQLVTANVAQVGGLLEDLEDYERWSVDKLGAIKGKHAEDSQPHLFASLALLRTGRGNPQDLTQALLTSDPETLRLLCDELRPYRDRLTEMLWHTLQDTSLDLEQSPKGRPFNRRFNAGLVLADFDPPDHDTLDGDEALDDNDENRWSDQSEFIANQLIYFANIDRQYYPTLVELIRPATAVVVGRLAEVMVDTNETELRQAGAQTMLTDLLREDARELTNRFLLARIDQIKPVLKLIDSDRGGVRALLDEVISQPIDISNPDWQVTAQRKAMAAALLLRHQASNELIWSMFKADELPDTRTRLVNYACGLEVDANLIAQRLLVETDDSIRGGLVQVLGEYPTHCLTGDIKDRTLTLVKGWFNNARTAGLRSNSLWFLLRWEGDEATLRKRLAEPVAEDPGRDWYVDGFGNTLVKLPKHDPDDAYRLDAGIAEVSVRQFQQMEPDYEPHPTSSPTIDCAANNITFHKAVEYCNWLTREAGLDDQLCYPDRDSDTSNPVELYPDYRQRTGYRLATKDEWFMLFRGGAKTDYSFGQDQNLADGYGIFRVHGRHTFPVGTAKPNYFGVFTMIGGCREWTSAVDPSNPKRRALCGMSYRYDKDMLEPEEIGFGLADLRYSFHGFRVVRSRPMRD